MVNIIDCIRNVTADRYGMIKIFILSIPALICTYATLSGQVLVSGLINLIFGIIFLAVFFETIRRSCNAEPILLPSFLMPVRMFLTLGLTIVSAIPVFIVCVGLYILLGIFLKDNPQVLSTPVSYYITCSVFGLLITSLFFSSITQYLDTGKVFDAYNPMKVLRALKTFIVNLLFFIIQDVLAVAIFVIIPAMVIYMLGGQNPNNFFLIVFLCMGGVFNYLVFADYIGQTKKDSESPYERLF